MFDVTFLTSNWTCIFGNGCQGVLTGPAPELVQGCCSYGAHLVNKKDARRVEKAAATLTPDEWQNHGTKKAVIHENKSGETVTRLVDDACIFLNKPDFPGGVGCAFHIAAMNRGVDHMTLKPEVCWQLPLRREDAVDDDEGHVTSVIRQWDRRHWGKGGREFHWWCTESPEAFVGTKPVYREMQPELTKMVGTKAYDHFVELVEERDRLRTKGVAVPHPAVRSRGGDERPGARSVVRGTSSRSARSAVQSFSGSSSATALVGMEPEDAVVLVLLGQAPGRVDIVGLCPTLGTPPRRLRRRPLQTARFLEAPMASLFHENSLSHPDRISASAPLRPDRTGHVDRRSIVVVVGGIPARPQVRAAGGTRPAGARTPARDGRPCLHLCVGLEARVADGGPQPLRWPACPGSTPKRWSPASAPGPRRSARVGCRRSKVPSGSAFASRPSRISPTTP